MVSHEAEFWSENEEYHDLAEYVEDRTERHHPDTVTSRGMCVCLDFTHHCGWSASKVDYYRYTGENIQGFNK